MNKMPSLFISILIHLFAINFIIDKIKYDFDYTPVKVSDNSVDIKTIVSNVKKNNIKIDSKNNVKINNIKEPISKNEDKQLQPIINKYSGSNNDYSKMNELKDIELLPSSIFKGNTFEISKGKSSINKTYKVENKNFEDVCNLDEDLRNSNFVEESESEVKILGRRGEFLYKPSFPYPKDAEKLGLEGEIKLILHIDSNGNVCKAIPLNKVNSILEDDAIRRAYQYKIALYNDKNVRCSAECEIVITYKIRR